MNSLKALKDLTYGITGEECASFLGYRTPAAKQHFKKARDTHMVTNYYIPDLATYIFFSYDQQFLSLVTFVCPDRVWHLHLTDIFFFTIPMTLFISVSDQDPYPQGSASFGRIRILSSRLISTDLKIFLIVIDPNVKAVEAMMIEANACVQACFGQYILEELNNNNVS